MKYSWSVLISYRYLTQRMPVRKSYVSEVKEAKSGRPGRRPTRGRRAKRAGVSLNWSYTHQNLKSTQNTLIHLFHITKYTL